MTPILRLSRPDDLSVLRDLDLKCHVYPFSAEVWQMLAQKSGQRGEARCVLVQWNEKSIGLCVWRISDDEDHIEILRLGVLPECRRRGVGKLLVKNLEQVAATMGVPELRITVPDIHCCPGEPDDVSAFLRKMGFRAKHIEFEWKELYGEVRDGYVFAARAA